MPSSPPLLPLLPLLLASAALLLVSLQTVTAQLGGSASTPVSLSNGAQYRGAIDSNLNQPTYQYFNFTIAPTDPALATASNGEGSDLLFVVETLGGADPLYLGLVVTDPAGNVYADDTAQGVAVASVQITSSSAGLSSSQPLLAGSYAVQLVAEAPSIYAQFPGGSKYYQLSVQLQPRTLLTAGTATALLLPAAFNGLFPAGSLAHADYAATTAAFYIVVSTAAAYTDTTVVAPWLVWEQGSAMQDVAVDDALEYNGNFISGPQQNANYQLYWYAGDPTCSPTCYLHFLAISKSSVPSPAISIIPTSTADVITALSTTGATSFTAAALSIQYFSFTVTLPQANIALSLSGGNADMYVSAAAAVSGPYVDQSTALWKATVYTAPNVINIAPLDPYFFSAADATKPGRQTTMSGVYYVAVFALQAGTYSLQLSVVDAMANAAATPLSLTFNSTATASDFVTPAAPIKYYTFTVPDTLNTNVSDLVLSLNTSCSDLYLSDVTAQPGPSSGAAAVYSSTQPASDVVVLTGAFAELHSGQYWIGVSLSNTAVASCPFVLSVSFDVRSQVELNVELRQTALAAGVIRYYDIFVPPNQSIDFRAIINTNNTPVALYASANYPVSTPYSDPSPFNSATYAFSISSDGSDPVVSLLLLQTRAASLQLPTFCQTAGGCVQTLAVFSPFGSGGIPSFLLEVSPFFTATLQEVTDGVPVITTAASEQFLDLSYELDSTSANCTVNLTLLSAGQAGGSPSVLLCVVRNLGEVWLLDNARPDCDWYLNVAAGTTATSSSVSFNATSPAVTGALPQYNNVLGTSMSGTYRMLAITYDYQTVSGLNATYSISQTCLPYDDSLNAPAVNAPIASGQSITQTIDAASTAFYTLDLTNVPIDANTDISVVITGSNVRLPTGTSPSIALSYSQSVPQVSQFDSDFSDITGGLQQQLINLASYPSLSSGPLYLSVYAEPRFLLFGTEQPLFGIGPIGHTLNGPLTFTITTTISQRTTLAVNTPQTLTASSASPVRWWNVLVPTTTNSTSAIFALSTANISASPQMVVLSDPLLDPNFDDEDMYTYELNNVDAFLPVYSAGGVIVFNNAACQPTAAGMCRYVVGVYTPTPTDYTLLLSGTQDNAPPAAIATLTAGTPITGTIAAAATSFYQFYIPNTSGTVNVTLTTTIGGNADLFVGVGNATGPTYVTNTETGYVYPAANNPALFFTSGSAAVKTISFGSGDVAQPTVQGYYAITLLGQAASTQFTLSLSVSAPSTPNVTVIPIGNKQQLAGVVDSTGSVVYALQVDGSAGLNSDVVVLVQPDLSRAVAGVMTELAFTISRQIPVVHTNAFWSSPFGQPANQPIAFVLNSQSAPECSTCSTFDPTVNQTLYITVYAELYNAPVGGPFLISVTYAPRVALSPSSSSYTGSALAAGITQTFTYVPSAANVAPASFYASVATASAGAGQVALFSAPPDGSGQAGIAPLQLISTSYVDLVSATQPTLYNGYTCSYIDPSQCVWYLQVLALTSISGYTLTVTDQPPVANVVPGVPSTIALTAAACSEVVFNIPLAQSAASFSLVAAASPAVNVSLFLDDDSVSTQSAVHFPDSTSAYWTGNSLTTAPVTVTPSDSIFSVSQSYLVGVGTSGNFYATLCAQLATTVSLTVAVAAPLPIAPVQATVNSGAVAGSVAAGAAAYANVTVISVAGSTSSLAFTLTAASSSLVMWVSASFYPGPTAAVPFANFTSSAYETSIGYSTATSSYPTITLLPTVGSGKVKLTASTTYYVTVYNTAAASAAASPFSLTVTGSGVNAAPPAPSSTASVSSAAPVSSSAAASSSSISSSASVTSSSPVQSSTVAPSPSSSSSAASSTSSAAASPTSSSTSAPATSSPALPSSTAAAATSQPSTAPSSSTAALPPTTVTSSPAAASSSSAATSNPASAASSSSSLPAAVPSSSSSGSSSSSSSSSGLSHGQLAGAIIGPVLAVLLCCLVVAFFVSRRSSDKHSKAGSDDRSGDSSAHSAAGGDIEMAHEPASEDSRVHFGSGDTSHGAEDSRVGV